MSEKNILITIMLCSLVTFLLRAIPFILFGSKKELPFCVKYIGKVLPSVIMITLVIYCLKDISFNEINKTIITILSSVVVAILHIIKKNTILSITIGTVIYMILIRVY